MGAQIFRGSISGKMIDACVKALQKGEMIIYPTDTIYGIGCDMFNQKALTRLNQLKQRPKDKPFSFICNDINEAAKFATISNSAHRVMRHALPGPYTFVLPVNSMMPRKMINSSHAVGVRIPDHPVPLEIVRCFGNPITTTSVNIATEEPVCSVDDLSQQFLDAVSVVIDEGAKQNEPSTIIDFTEEMPKIVRQGKGLEELRPYVDFVLEE
jgi:tRNA threonylcarbamoyl adenosine modification protein (Sua5/YciO/YrdC/YwlC family)